MRNGSFLQMFIVPLILGQFACKDANDQNPSLIRERAKILLDSIGRMKIIACYTEHNSICILEYENKIGKKAQKLIYRIGYPLFTDTLVYVKPNEFKSKHLNTTYLIKDSAVLSINYVKIIHPSSNWQGQTPWSQPYVTTYKRIDNQIK